jgi:hypothetical protein
MVYNDDTGIASLEIDKMSMTLDVPDPDQAS